MSTQTPPPDSIGPYRIDALLGTGGMGEVYKAYDPRLDRWVAVKQIRPEYADNSAYRKRLEREARTIASLDHPAIVQVFDVIKSADGGDWIVMEFVDGPTLYNLLKSGPLETGTAVALGLDVVHGLAQAHGRGILHRDLKSENVMISRSGAAKILDFGLAKREHRLDEVTISMEGKVIGTCRVMAPEQANGLELDGRADLFAFGILLYEMVTACSPFRASTPVASMLKAFSEPHRPVLDYDPDLPEELSELIDQLLAKNREDRPENAQVVAARLATIASAISGDPALGAAQIRWKSRSWSGSDRGEPGVGEFVEDPLDETVPGGGPTLAVQEGSPAPRGSRAQASPAAGAVLSRPRAGGDQTASMSPESTESRWGRTLSAAFGFRQSPSRRVLAWTAWLLLSLTVWWAVGSSGPSVPLEPGNPRIAVLPFGNLGPDRMSHFVTGLTDELIRELTARPGLAVVSYRTAAQYGSDQVSLKQIGDELGVGYVVEGSVASSAEREDTRLRVILRLLRVADGQVLLSRSLERTTSDTFRLQTDLADAISAELGVRILADTGRDLSANPVALDAFFRGLTLWHGSGYTNDVAVTAERYFERAVSADPDFVRAWSELTQVRSMIFFNGNRTPDARRRAEEAVTRCRELAPAAVTVLLASGYFEYHVLGDLTAAQAEFERAMDRAPNQHEAQEAMGFVLRRQGKLDEAIEYLESAFDLDRANSVLAGFLGETERARRHYGQAETWFAEALKRSSDLSYVVGERAENLLAIGGCGSWGEPVRCATAEARRILDDSDLRDSPSLWGYRVRVAAYDLANGGSLEEFLALYDSVSERHVDSTERYRLFWRKVLALRQLGRQDEARVLAERYAEELQGIAMGSEFTLHHAALSMALALLERRSESEAELARAVELASHDVFTGPNVGRWTAAVRILLGEPEAAVAALDAMSLVDCQQGLASYELRADPAWQPLRDLGLLEKTMRRLRQLETAHLN